MPITSTERHRTLIQYSFEGVSSDGEVRHFIESFRSYMRASVRERTPYGFVINGGNSVGLSAMQRQALIEADKINRPLFIESGSFMAVVLHNALHRGVLTALRWFLTFPDTFYSCADEAEALLWVNARLKRSPRASSRAE